MENWATIGHDHIKQVLDAQMRNNQLAHAYLFQGPKGVGKSILAEEFAHFVSPAVTSRMQWDLAINSSVAELRELLKLVSLTSVDGGVKTIIIRNFQSASQSVSNALLKTLEEPPSRTIFILLANSHQVLPTIISRCVTLRFGPLSENQMKEFAEVNSLSINESALQFAAGVPEQLQNYLSGDESAIELATLLKKLDEAGKQSLAKKMAFVQELAEYETEFLAGLLHSWIHSLKYRLQQDTGLYKATQVALETLKRLMMNGNKKMTLEYFLINTQI